MLVSSIIDEVKEGIGKCDTAFALRTITRAVQLLANKGLIDPLIGYFDFSLGEASNFVALPRDVKTLLRVNINNSPSFARSRLYEFNINADGTVVGNERGLSWQDRGYSPIQDELKLPGKLRYKVSAAGDNDKTLTVYGLDADGRKQTEVLVGNLTNPDEGAIEFHKIERVIREATGQEAFLWCNGSNVIGQYYGDETLPNYRVIKLSQSPAAVRVMFRRQVFAVSTVDDFIPMDSEMAVIEACKAVRFLVTDEYQKAEAALLMAERFLKEEQAAREEHNTIADNQEIQPAIDAAIVARDGIIVADVYDVAAEIFGGVGRRKLFDKITTAIELLSNKGQWDARLGAVDVFSADNDGAVTYDTAEAQTGQGHGYYVLPRHVETPVSISYPEQQTRPRNRWFEFHLNGDGAGRNKATHGAWDDAGEVCLLKPLPLNPADSQATRRALPTYFVAIPDNNADDGTEVRIFGFERDSSGKDIEVWRGGARGWLCPCVAGNYDPGQAAPAFVAVDRITKGESQGFIRLYATSYTPPAPGDPEVPEFLEVEPWVNAGAGDYNTVTLNEPGSSQPWTGDGTASFTDGAEKDVSVMVGVLFDGVEYQVSYYDLVDNSAIFPSITSFGIGGGGTAEITAAGANLKSVPREGETQTTDAYNLAISITDFPTLAMSETMSFIVRRRLEHPADTSFDPTFPAGATSSVNWVSGAKQDITIKLTNELGMAEMGVGGMAWLGATEITILGGSTLAYTESDGVWTIALDYHFSPFDTAEEFAHVTIEIVGVPAPGDWVSADVYGGFSFTVDYTAAVPTGPEVPGYWTLGDLYGFWYPDELEPKYRMVRLAHSAPRRIRILYRKRTPKVSGLFEPIPLRSRAAIEQALRALKAGETDPALALSFEQTAYRYLREERINTGPTAQGIFQFDDTTSPGFTGNIR